MPRFMSQSSERKYLSWTGRSFRELRQRLLGRKFKIIDLSLCGLKREPRLVFKLTEGRKVVFLEINEGWRLGEDFRMCPRISLLFRDGRKMIGFSS